MLSPTDKGADGGLLRIQADKVGKLMDLIGELSLSVAATVHAPELEGLELPNFEAASHRLSMIMRDVQDAASELRLVEVEEVFKRLRRMIREMERETGKQIEMLTVGADTLIDKLVADRLYEPLLHVLRNSADHGLETTAGRIEAGKAPAGRITLGAVQQGNEVRITVDDDGRGLNYDRILAKAQERGLFAPGEQPEPDALWPVIFQPGFSTATEVSNLSGRGVGMDVLNNALSALRGRIGITSVAGQGTCVALHIPLTLSFLDCVILRHGPRLFALPIDMVNEILRPQPGSISRISASGNGEVLRSRGETIPVVRLERPDGSDDPEDGIVVVAITDSGLMAIAVDEVIDRQQVVMKPLLGRLSALRASWGLALLNNGDVATVLDCERLVRKGAA
jgi:two-component system, chemotaxis family, sensor kinase CheA